MNAPEWPAGAAFDEATLQRAREMARSSGRPVVAELEALTGCEPRQIVADLAGRFHLPVIDTPAMLACSPALDLLPLVRAQTRGCVLLRSPADGSGSTVVGVIADPFDGDCLVWLGSLSPEPMRTHLALAADIQAYLRQQMPEWKRRYPGVEDMRVAVMGCVVNGPGESKHADIGISLPGTGESPVAPVYVDGERRVTLKGDGIAAEFQAIVEQYVKDRYGAVAPGA